MNHHVFIGESFKGRTTFEKKYLIGEFSLNIKALVVVVFLCLVLHCCSFYSEMLILFVREAITPYTYEKPFPFFYFFNTNPQKNHSPIVLRFRVCCCAVAPFCRCTCTTTPTSRSPSHSLKTRYHLLQYLMLILYFRSLSLLMFQCFSNLAYWIDYQCVLLSRCFGDLIPPLFSAKDDRLCIIFYPWIFLSSFVLGSYVRKLICF